MVSDYHKYVDFHTYLVFKLEVSYNTFYSNGVKVCKTTIKVVIAQYQVFFVLVCLYSVFISGDNDNGCGFITVLYRDHRFFFFWRNLYVCFAKRFVVFVFQGQSIGMVEVPLRIRNNCILYIRFLFFGWFSVQHSFVESQLRRLQNIDMVYID
eukprot:TRINITY_DN244_c0_g2_i6.p4 TRINITY_DN244_c0_g2~~TRINITY_DN244_c0_g2_i6.p4  ORF type:complete len:153 (+),score=4.30 TRINITY_DN244_c0_g2_i6:2026-2484(+)